MGKDKGGMYELLKLIVILLAKQQEITSKELQPHTNLSGQTITNNLSRLVKVGVLIKTEERIRTGGRIVKYKLKLGGGTIDFLIKTLYD